MVLASIQTAQPSLISGAQLAATLQKLMNHEVAVGGPYADHNQKPGFITNSLIAQFLKTQGVVLPQLESFIATSQASIKRSHACFAPTALKYLLTEPNDQSKLPLASAQRMFTKPLSPIHRDLFETITSLRKLTTKTTLGAVIGNDIYDRVLKATQEELKTLPAPLGRTGFSLWQQMYNADRNYEIALLPSYINELLIDSRASQHQLVLLGQANFYCWIATILYDDFLDEEGKPALLPLAHITQRLGFATYRNLLLDQPKLLAQIESYYLLVDRANAWEVAETRCRVHADTITFTKLPRYGSRRILAHRAYGHIMGSLLLLHQVPNATIRAKRLVERALEDYLIARQLNDDLHDWRKDLRVGQISAVLADLLRGAGIKAGSYPLDQLTEKLEAQFLQSGLRKTCRLLLKHVHQSQASLRASGLCHKGGAFFDILDDLASSAHAALAIQQRDQLFLQSYRLQTAGEARRSNQSLPLN